MPQFSLEQRVAALERQVAQIKIEHVNGPAKKDWRRTVGIFTDNPQMLELFADAMKIREVDRKKARRRQRKGQRVKS
ncbi:MAG: hypothetical protein L0Y72_20325 [Gemmataceae bacterium]|nr:hypothetical protein [Gemmataceae bacterium]MCI0741385.1 hypothetical protein [Gemmataceae bacterium]